MTSAIEQINQTIALLNKYEGQQIQPFQYQAKGHIQVTNPQFVADMKEGVK